MEAAFLWVKALHIMAVIAWMAGLFYLPRLYVYHAAATAGGEASETFKTMEAKLLKVIMNPAMIAAWVFGLALWIGWGAGPWMHAKFVLVLAMSGYHGFLAKLRKDFKRDENARPEKFFRLINEIPTLLMVVIVILVVVKPF